MVNLNTKIFEQKSGLRSVVAFASDLGVSTRVVEAWLQRGQLRSVKIGRRRLIDVDASLAAIRGS